METDTSRLEADFLAYNKTGDTAAVGKYAVAEVERFIKEAYARDNTPALMAARSGAVRYLATLRGRRPSFLGRLARFFLGLLALGLIAAALLIAGGLLARR
ncbi:MAG: hypothetical protein ACM3L6_01420 [Deltaproteobacteria bacterium]